MGPLPSGAGCGAQGGLLAARAVVGEAQGALSATRPRSSLAQALSAQPPRAPLSAPCEGPAPPGLVGGRQATWVALGSPQGLCSFSRWREALTALCLQSMDQGAGLWVGVLPVLHGCAERPAGGGDAGFQREDAWAALEGVPFKEFREKRADG